MTNFDMILGLKMFLTRLVNIEMYGKWRWGGGLWRGQSIILVQVLRISNRDTESWGGGGTVDKLC